MTEALPISGGLLDVAFEYGLAGDIDNFWTPRDLAHEAPHALQSRDRD